MPDSDRTPGLLTLTGWKIREFMDDEAPELDEFLAIDPASFQVLLPDLGQTLSYDIVAFADDGFPIVDFSADLYAVMLDQLAFSPEDESITDHIGRVTADGQFYDILLITSDVPVAPNEFEFFVFQIGGSAPLDFADVAEFTDFEAAITAVDPIPAGQPFEPGVPFPLNTLPGATLSEAPQILRGGEFFEGSEFYGYGHVAGSDGSLTVGNGAVFVMDSTTGNGPFVAIGRNPGASGIATVAGPGSGIEVVAGGGAPDGVVISVGRDGASGALRVLDGAVFAVSDPTGADNSDATDGGETMSVGRAGFGVVQVVAAGFFFEGTGANLQVGRDGGIGNFSVSAGSDFLLRTTSAGEADFTHLRIGIGGGEGGYYVDRSNATVQGGTNGGALVTVGAGAGRGFLGIEGDGFDPGTGGPLHGLLVRGGANSPAAGLDIGQGGEGGAAVEGGYLNVMNDAGFAYANIGFEGGEGIVSVLDQGLLAVRGAERTEAVVGNGPGALGIVEVTGDSRFFVEGLQGFTLASIGRDGGEGRLSLDDGSFGFVVARGTGVSDAHLRIGDGPGGQGVFRVLGGSGFVVESDESDAWLIAGGAGGIGDVLIDGAYFGVEAARNGGIRLGQLFGPDETGTAAMQVVNGALVEIRAGENGQLLVGGSEGSDAQLTVQSAGVIDMLGRGALGVGVGDGAFGGRGDLLLSGAGSELRGLLDVSIGRGAFDSRGTVRVEDEAWLRIGHPDFEGEASVTVGRETGNFGELLIDRALVSQQGSVGTNAEGAGYETYTVIGRDGATGLLTITGDLATDPDALHGYVQVGGGDGGFSIIDVGRGPQSDGDVRVTGGVLVNENRGVTYSGDGSGTEVDLPGDGGAALLRIGRNGDGFGDASGRVLASDGAEVTNLATLDARTLVGVGSAGAGILNIDASSFENRSLEARAGLEIGNGVSAEEFGGLPIRATGSVAVRNMAEARIEGRGEAYVNVGREIGSDGTLRVETDSLMTVRSLDDGAYVTVGQDDAAGDLRVTEGARLELDAGGIDRSAQLEIGRNSTADGVGGRAQITDGASVSITAVDFANLLVGTEGGRGALLMDASRIDMAGRDANIRIGTRWSDSADKSGDGTLTLQNGAELVMDATGFSSLLAGGWDGGTGRVEMSSGALLDMGGRGSLGIGEVFDGEAGDGLGMLSLDGAGTLVRGVRYFNVGWNGAEGSVDVANGARMLLGGLDIGDFTSMELGRGVGSLGEMTIDRALVSLQGTTVDGFSAYTTIGRDGGTGSLTIVGDRATEADPAHGYIQIGGGTGDFSTIDIGRGGGSDGTVTVKGAFFGSENRGKSYSTEPPFDEIDLPGDGGVASIRVGVEGGTGRLVASANAEVFAESGDPRVAGLFVGQGGTGSADFDASSLSLSSTGNGVLLSVGVNAGGAGEVVFRNGAVATLSPGAGETGKVVVGQNGGTGRLEISGAGSLVETLGSAGRVSIAETTAGGPATAGTVIVAEGGRLVAGDSVLAGTAGEPQASALVVLDGGTVETGRMGLTNATLAGSGLLSDSGGAAGFLDLSASALQIGDGLAAGDALEAAIGALTVSGDMVKTGGNAVFDFTSDAADFLDVAGSLDLSGSTLELAWLGGGPAVAGAELRLARATGGIVLDDVDVTAGFAAPDLRLELREGETELWALYGEPPPSVFALTGTVDLRAFVPGAVPLSGTEVTFTGSDGVTVLTSVTDATGAFAFDIPAGLDGTLEVVRDYSTGAGDKAVDILDVLEQFELVAGIRPPATVGPQDLIAANFNGDRFVDIFDVLELFNHVALPVSAFDPTWLFVDDDADLSGVSATSMPLPSEFGAIAIGPMSGDVSLGITGILSGDLAGYT